MSSIFIKLAISRPKPSKKCLTNIHKTSGIKLRGILYYYVVTLYFDQDFSFAALSNCNAHLFESQL